MKLSQCPLLFLVLVFQIGGDWALGLMHTDDVREKCSPRDHINTWSLVGIMEHLGGGARTGRIVSRGGLWDSIALTHIQCILPFSCLQWKMWSLGFLLQTVAAILCMPLWTPSLEPWVKTILFHRSLLAMVLYHSKKQLMLKVNRRSTPKLQVQPRSIHFNLS